MYLSVEEYDAWALQKQGLSSVSHIRFLHIVTRVMFGHGVCTLGASEIERRAKISSRTRLRVMKQLEEAGVITVNTVVTSTNSVRHEIRRTPITTDDLQEFAQERFAPGLDNSLQFRLKTGEVLPALHESFFTDDVGSQLVFVEGEPRFVANVGDSPDLSTEPPARSGGHNRIQEQQTNQPTARPRASASQSSASDPRLVAKSPAGGSGSEARVKDPVAYGSGRQRLGEAESLPVGRLVDVVLAALTPRFESLERALGLRSTTNSDPDSPRPPKPPTEPIDDVSEEDADTLLRLQQLVMSLAVAEGVEDEVKPISKRAAPKILKAVRKVGGVNHAEDYLRYVFSKDLGWFANFCWKDRDVYALLCNGAIKEWRIESGRTRETELKTEKKHRRKRGRQTGRDRLRDREWQKDDPTQMGEVGEW